MAMAMVAMAYSVPLISAISKILVIRWRSSAVQSTARLKCTKMVADYRHKSATPDCFLHAAVSSDCPSQVTRTKHLISIMDGGAVTRPRAAQLLLHYDYQSG